jgi:chromosome transmission fidelity protein 18
VRQVLDQELQKTIAQREGNARLARLRSGGASRKAALDDDDDDEDKENAVKNAEKLKAQMMVAGPGVKRDFFGRIIVEKTVSPLGEVDGNAGAGRRAGKSGEGDKGKVWVTYHEGLNNAVRKPISLEEFLRGF